MTENPQVVSLIRKLRREKRGEMLMRIKKQGVMTAEALGEREVNRITDFDIKDNKVTAEADGYDYPYKGFPDGETAMLVAMYKRFLPLIAKRLKEQNWLARIITVISLALNKKIASEWFEYIFTLGYYLLKDEYWMPTTKELRRVLAKHFESSIVDAISLAFEYDDAYRYPVQDILAELKKENLTGYFATRKEVLRLLKIYIERSKRGSGDRMESLIKLAKLALFVPKINKTIREILIELDIDKIKFDEVDRFWVNLRKEYKYNI